MASLSKISLDQNILPDTLKNALLDIVDEQDRPFMVMSALEAIKQNLCRRFVMVVLYGGDKLYLQKPSARTLFFPSYWDVSACGHVHAGESREDAARRLLEKKLGIRATHMFLQTKRPARREDGNVHISLFQATAPAAFPAPDNDEVEDILALDKEELFAFYREFKDMFTPGLTWCIESGLIFPEANKGRHANSALRTVSK